MTESAPRIVTGRRPALDGLRAVAISLVIVYHATFGSGWLPGGFVGVDVFFVISGFLITSLLLAEHQRTGTISLRQFYGRRAVRLAPALVLTLAGVGLLAVTVGNAPGTRALWQQALESLSYVINWVHVVHPVPSGYLDHTWSLAVEEQFYLVWPILLLVVMRRRWSLLRIAAVSAAGVVAVDLGRAALVAVRPPSGSQYVLYYEATIFRADALLVGIVAACLLAAAGPVVRSSRTVRVLAAVLPWVAVVVLAWITYRVRVRAAFLYQVGEPMLTVATAVLVVHAVTAERSVLNRILASAPMRGLGRISYAVYLFHVPLVLVVVNHTHWSPLVRLVVVFGASVGLAVASWWLVERPAQSLRRYLVPRQAPPGIAAPAEPAAPAANTVPFPREMGHSEISAGAGE
jgi:peptidoglycan/LPS O-acetylase OafA/YrhL